MAAKKLINISSFPIGIKGESVLPGEVFEEEGLAAQSLVGNEKAVEATPENIKQFSGLKEQYLQAKKPQVKKSDKK